MDEFIECEQKFSSFKCMLKEINQTFEELNEKIFNLRNKSLNLNMDINLMFDPIWNKETTMLTNEMDILDENIKNVKNALTNKS